jgi:trehalose 6-phosphate synthase
VRRVLRFLVPLLTGLAVLVVAGYFTLVGTMRAWFHSDLALRSRLAVASARQSLAQDWRKGDPRLAMTLTDITRDERIMAAAACSLDGEMLTATSAYPIGFSCRSVLDRMHKQGGHNITSWAMTTDLPSGRVHLSVNLIEGDHGPLGAVVLVHDLSDLEMREATTRNFLLVAFFILSLGAASVTLFVVYFTRRGWTKALRRALKGAPVREFQPLLRDVRALAERMAVELEQESRGGQWSAARLRATLTQHLQGERIVILANREPYVHERQNGELRVLHPASGLVTALEPVMRACSGVWVAHGSGSADRETVDAHDRVRVPPGEESYVIRRVWLTEQEEKGYYYGFSNEGLWPLCHVAHVRPTFRSEDWESYRAVNQRFSEAVCQEVDRDDPIILVQDYHLALAPKMIRERLPRATIISFWHIPWPNGERFGICPWREEIIAGLLGSSIVGFHTQQHCNNFIDSVDAFVESRIDRETRAIVQGDRRTLIRPYPISIAWPVHWLDQVPPVEEARAEVRKEFGLPADILLGVGIDRLDYTKGIEERLLAIDALFARYPEFRGKLCFVQIAAPSRTKIDSYQELAKRVEATVNAINARWSQGSDYRPILLVRAHQEPVSVFRFHRAADFCYVSSLHDGMNLVAKEYVAAREDEQGVLVLSQFTGAARDLPEALVVNPYDLKQSSDAIATALRMSKEEQRERMQAMRRFLSQFNVYRWAGRMLVDAAELRRKDRLFGRFGNWGAQPPTVKAEKA